MRFASNTKSFELMEKNFRIDQTLYHFTIFGEGKPLLLLHGFTGSKESWRGVIPSLAKTWRVIAVDLPGHGQTIAPDDVTAYTMPVVAGQLARLIERAAGEPAHVLGYSMGGRLALYLALAHPAWVSALTLESASPGLEAEAERAARVASDEGLAARIERDGIEKFVEEWEKLPLFASQAQLPAHARAELRAQRLRNRPHELALSLRGMGTGAQPSLWGKIERSDRLSVNLIAGELDTKFVGINRRMQALMPNARLKVVAGAGHSVHLEKPETWAAIVSQTERKSF